MRIFGVAVILAITWWGNPALSDTIDINGVARTYILQLADTRPAPLVIVLHGNTQTGNDMVTRTSWPAVARREHFGVVFPDGLNRAWADLRPDTRRAGRAPPKGTDDVGFIVRLIEKFVADGSADPKRIYVTGVSNGGAMTMSVIGARADLFAAAASVIFNITDDMANAIHPSRPVPMLMINGTADPLIPYEGGRGTSRFAVSGFWSDRKDVRFLATRQRLRGAGSRDGRSRAPRSKGSYLGDANLFALSARPRRRALSHQQGRPPHALRAPGRALPAHRQRSARPAKPGHRQRRDDLGFFSEVSVNASAFRKDLFNVPTSIEHANDFRPTIVQTIEYHLKAGGE